MRRVWLSRIVILALLAGGVVLTAAEGRGKSSRKKGDGEGEKAAEKAAVEKKELPRAVYIDQFRKAKDPESMEIVALHDEIDQYYAELTTVRNVAAGEDREARKAEREVKGLETKIKRQVRKLEAAVEKYTRPRRKEHDETRRKYEELREKGDKLGEQGQDRKATETYQLADRLTGPLESMKRQIEVEIGRASCRERV